MMKRILFTAIAVVFLLTPSQLVAQGAGGGGESTLGLPVISARIETSADSLFHVDGNREYFPPNNLYNPNTMTVEVWVRNIGETGASPADTAVARHISVSIRQDTRFQIVGASTKPLVNPLVGGDSLRNGDSAAVTFELIVASPRDTDGLDEIAGIVISMNANHVVATKDIWVQHEHFPVFRPLCTKQFADIVWDENINDYNPNPFTIELTIENIGDGISDSTVVVYIGTPDVSLDPADEEEKFLGRLRQGEVQTTTFQLRPRRRNNDTTLTLCFQVRGIGGYERRYYLGTCCVDVFIPAAKQPEYDLTCAVEDGNGNDLDLVQFLQHKYQPDPFVFTVDVSNIGTALGKDVKAKIILPPSINLAAGETEETKSLGDLATNANTTVSWELSPTRLFERDTLLICVRVFDAFNNQATCCDSVVIDSIRRAIFDVACVCPDTIYADQQAGVYTNSPFDVFFHVRNIGSDYADSVVATILIQNPIIAPVQGYDPQVRKDPDTLSVDGGYTFVWPLEAFPAGIGTTVRIKFTVRALNAEPVECVCEVYVQRLDAPNLDVWCETIPEDSLHFDPRTGGYFPPTVTYRVCATNIGGGIARTVKATLSIPPRMILADGETAEKFFNPGDLGPGDTSCVEWLLIPVQRTDFGSLAVFRAEVTSENVPERPICEDDVFVPALPSTAALSIPRNNVGYYNQIILAPIFIDDPEGKDIKKFEIELRYNVNDDGTRMQEDVVEFVDVVTTNSLTAEWNILNQGRNQTNDVLNFAIESVEPLSFPVGVPAERIPPLVWLRFRGTYGDLPPDDLQYSATPVKWPEPTEVEDRIRINDGSIFPRVTDGLVTVSGDCLRPLTASPDYVIFNKPNPFNPVTTIEYTIPTDEQVKISVYDALGRSVGVLVDEYVTAGTHNVVFDAKGLPSGIYFYRMETPQYSTMKKMVVSK